MKNLYFFLILFFGVLGFGQDTPCVSDVVLQNFLEANPSARIQMDEINKLITQQKSFNKSAQSYLPGSITIPVVVYVVHEGTTSSNISDFQVQSQLSALNNRFLNTGIKFCLATKANTGTKIPTTSPSHIQDTAGIIHVNNATLSNHFSTAAGQSALLGIVSPTVTNDRYLKIWVVNKIDGGPEKKGYATFPTFSPTFDGIVITNNVFGSVQFGTNSSNLFSIYQEGEILVHEVGHYLGLYHTFNGGCSTPNNNPLLDGDLVDDTPTVNAPNYDCIANTNSCIETPAVNDLIHNYMDYGNDACRDSFTSGQIDRMIAQINFYRSNLISPENIIFTGTCGSTNLLSATITASPYTICSGGQVTFSVPSANQYLWNFGDGSTSTIQNPTHTYSSAAGSPYTVTVTVTNTTTGATATSLTKIFVTACSPIINEDAYWFQSMSNGVSFQTGIPVFDPSFPTDKNCNYSSIIQNNSSGNPLFYGPILINNTNPGKVFNNLHNSINQTSLDYSSLPHNSALSVPNPGSPNQYTIFTNNFNPNDIGNINTGFRRSIVNVSGTTATMDSATTRLPITIPTGYSTASDGAVRGGSCVTAIQNCNGYWIITKLRKNDGNYYLVAYSFTSSGLIYNNGSEFLIPTERSCSIKASPNGNKLFLYNTGHEGGFNCIVDFNKTEGTFSNLVPITISNSALTGATFSPDSNLLYTTERDNFRLLQYNLNSNNIDTSRRVIGTVPNNRFLGEMQIGPDKKVYIGVAYGREWAVIHNPNNLATSNSNTCNFTLHGPFKNFGPVDTPVWAGMPNIINAKTTTVYPSLATDKISIYSMELCKKYKFFPNVCGASFNWEIKNIGTNTVVFTTTLANPEYQFTINGNYLITLKNASNTTLATKTLAINDLAVHTISGDVSTCSNSMFTNNSTAMTSDETAIWSVIGGTISGPNNQSEVSVNWNTLPGQINLTVTNAAGCQTTATQTITQKIQPTFSLQQSMSLCYGTTSIPTLPTTSTNTTPISGTWNPAVINTQILGTFQYVFTPNVGQPTNCPVTISVTITPCGGAIVPTFNVATTVCSGSIVPNLPTSSTNNPAITGTWSPAINSSATTTYTFIPNAGQNATSAQLTITIVPMVNPTFILPATSYCVGSTVPPLPTTSSNNPPIIGTWSPAINSSETTIYTFTPNAGQCANQATQGIKIIQHKIPTFDQVQNLCINSTPPDLPTTSLNNVQGSWNPMDIDTSVAGTFTYTFTPTNLLNSNFECPVETTMQISILPENDPNCGSNPCLTNLTLSTTETNTSFTYIREDWIQTNSNYFISANKNITFKAGNYILLKPNTHISGGSLFLGKIEDCSNEGKFANQTKENIQDEELSNKLTIYPNPTNGLVTISASDEINSILICSIDGKVIYANNDINKKSFVLNISNYQNGLYLINIETKTGTFYSKKIIKN